MIVHKEVTTEDVRKFWQKNPLCASIIPYPTGSPEFFTAFDLLREDIETLEFADYLHEFTGSFKKRVLDVGIGNGYTLSKYAENGAEVFGVDVTEMAVELSRKRFSLAGLSGDFRIADAQELPFENDTFDCVCSMGVLHHVPDIPKALFEIFRVLKPGGKLIVMFYHRNSAKFQFKYRVWSLLTGKPMDQLVNEFDGVGNPKGVVYSRKELGELLSEFNKLNMWTGYLETSDIILRGARFLPNKLFKRLERRIGWNLYAKAEKPK